MPRRARPFSCHGAWLAAVHVLLLAYGAAARRASSGSVPTRHLSCREESWEYRPSKLEALWTKNVREWGESDYCANVARFEQNITYWLQATKRLMLTPRARLSDTHGSDVFSSFITTYTCNHNTTNTRTTWIEPLAFCLRHPHAPCDRNAIEERSYMLLGSHSGGRRSHSRGHSPNAYFFDLGASTYAAGLGGPSQSFLIDAYKRRGIQFHRILLWEAEVHDPKHIYDRVPRELYHAYQYMNIGVTTDPSDPANPLNIIKAITDPSDFVAVKLDIDTPHLENELIQQILDDSEIYSRIDEFFFEQHVNFKPMLQNWKANIDPSRTLASSYELFLEMRLRGIRAHGWP